MLKGALIGAGATTIAVGFYCVAKKALCGSKCNKQTTATTSPAVPSARLTPENIKQEFLNRFEELTKFLLDDMKSNYEVPEFHLKYIDRLVRYNCLGGKYNRALYVIRTLVNWKKSLNLPVTEQELLEAQVLGWCVEWLQAFFLVADDIMDASVTRRNQPCWYRVEDVKMTACNDFIILESHMYRMLKSYFGANTTKYVQLVELFHDTTYQTEMGQLFDLRNQYLNKPNVEGDFTSFTLDEYKRIVKYKTAFYSFYMPLACGLIVASVSDAAIFAETKSICLMMGEYFQIQDDYLDCYADPKVLGKVGRDIEERKCCWLVVQALQRVNAEQLKILQDNYGKDDAECVKRVKQLYVDLNMTEIFKQYEEQAEKDMNAAIAKSILKKQNQDIIYADALSLIIKRQK